MTTEQFERLMAILDQMNTRMGDIKAVLEGWEPVPTTPDGVPNDFEVWI